MGKYSLTLGLAGLLVASIAAEALAVDSQPKQSNGRRLAMVLPKTTVAPVLPVRVVPRAVQVSSNKAVLPAIDPQAEFASHPVITPTPGRRQVPGDLAVTLLDSAARAEQLSRSYNRHVADLVVWVANSMKHSQSFTPIASPNLRWQQVIEPQPLNNSSNRITPID